MENTTQLLMRQATTLAGRRVLVADANDARLAELPGSITLHSDELALTGAEWAPLPVLAGDEDLLILPLPKAGERLEALLSVLAGQIRNATEVWLVGPAKGGIRGGVTRLKRAADGVEQLDSARHCKVFQGWLRPGPALALAALENRITVESAAGKPLQVVSYPGVFGHGRLDEGSRLLLEALAEDGPGTRGRERDTVLDLGCGAGVLSATLAVSPGVRLTAVDVSATAVAATRATLAANGLDGQVFGSDLFSAVKGQGPGRFHALVSNPPFHDGRERTMAITHRLIEQAPAYLRDGGDLWLVANRELPYTQWLNDCFRQVEIRRETGRFRVYRALTPRR